MASLNLSNFDTSNVTSMGEMFAGCSSLTSLDLSNFDTSNTTSMYQMFSFCSSLTSLDLSSFNTNKVTSMPDMFYDCSSLTSLDLSNFDTSNVKSMSNMFDGCRNLETIYVSDLWSTDNVDNGEEVFRFCYKLIGGNGTIYNSAYISSFYARSDTEGAAGYFTHINDTDIPIVSLSLDPETISIAAGNTLKLSVEIIPKVANKNLIWTSSDTSVLTVSSDGTITGLKSGSATVTATSNNNKTATSTIIVANSSQVDVITLNAKTAAYDGSYILANAATSLSGTRIVYRYYNSTDCSGTLLEYPPTNVGNYSVKATSAGNLNYVSGSTCVAHTIIKSDTTTNLDTVVKIYTGSSQEASGARAKFNSSNISNGLVRAKFTYEYYSNSTCTNEISTPSSLGTYYVKAILVGTDNYNGSTSSCTEYVITPDKVDTTTSLDEITKTYTGSSQAASGATAKLNINNSTINGATFTYKYYSNSTCTSGETMEAPVNVGTYYVKAVYPGNNVHNSSTSSCATYTINKSDTVTSLNTIIKTYTGSSQAASGATAKLNSNNTEISGATFTYKYYSNSTCTSGETTTAPTNAGTYYVKAILTGTGNYNSSTSGCIKYTMRKLDTTTNLSLIRKTYTGSSQAASGATAKLNSNNTEISGATFTYKYYDNGTCTSGETTTAPTNVGTYFVKATLTEGDIYGSSTSGCTVFYMNKSDTTTSLNEITKTYNGSSQAADGASAKLNSNNSDISGSSFTYLYYTNNTCTSGQSSYAPTNVGTYYVKATLTGTSNYNSSTSDCTKYTIRESSNLIGVKDTENVEIDNDNIVSKIDYNYVLTYGELLKKITVNAENYVVRDKNNNIVTDTNQALGTGARIEIGENGYIIIVKGDIDGNAKISSFDYIAIRKHMMNEQVIESGSYQFEAADIYSDGKISAFDYIKIRTMMMGD